MALSCDGFFALRIGEKKGVQHVTGLWRLERNGVDLTLLNLAYEPIRMSAGREAIHGTLPHAGHVALKPSRDRKGTFQITGILNVDGRNAAITDAGSGRFFPLPSGMTDQKMSGKFATAEIAIDGDQVEVSKLLTHSGSVPRFYASPRNVKPDKGFLEAIAGKFWLLPPMAGAGQAALHFSRPVRETGGAIMGQFDISGPGLRLDGQYEASGEKLTLKAGRASVRNLQLIGAGDVAAFFLGDFNWAVSARGLELTRQGRRVLLLPGS